MPSVLFSAIHHNLNNKGDYYAEMGPCVPCGYEYDPEVGDPDSGVEPGTAFEELPEDWVCPVCGVDKSFFEPVK